MAHEPITLLADSGATTIDDAENDGDNLWLSGGDLLRVTGFELKPEGLCRDLVCIPLPPGREAEFVRDTRVNLATFWRYRGGGVASTPSGDIWALSEPLDEQLARIDSLKAPDFALPDAKGTIHRLSDYRGQKVFLTTWASW
jgi:hypothetical protein